ncbi:MAG: ABC transporter substrate-binding protein [Candidatus Vecturithrix sp.]|jgi:branched-chain amino acid transport system substrate-binding protein|nr:ABC transporter substrate-binding protein [Candidatus Vecturithrix sp.]
MKRKIVVTLMICLLVGTIAIPISLAADDTIHIALTAPITGDYAEYGRNFERSVTMGMDFINSKGGVLGKKLILSVGDSKGDPKESATLAMKWTSDPTIVAQIGDFTSTCCLAGQPIYDQAGMIQLSPTASHPDFAPGSTWSFSIVGTQASEGPFMADWTYNELGFKKIAILHINNDWGIVTADYFADAFKKLGGEVVAKEFYFEGDKDFKAVLTKLKSSDADAFFMAAMYNDGALIAKQKASLSWEIPILGPSSLYSTQLTALGGDAVEGLYTNASFFAEDPDPAVQGYVQEFQKRFEATPNFHAALAYDAILLLADAIERAGTTESDPLREELAKTKDFPGLTGEITFTPAGDAVKKYKKVWVTNGKFELYTK